MNIVCFIPARGGSKSIPKKNIKILGDKPLIAWTIQSVPVNLIPDIVVNTDDPEIAAIAKEFGAEVMIRPTDLGGDKTSMLDVLRKEIPKLDPQPDVILLLQPTVPFRNTFHIKMAVEMLRSYWDKYDSVVTVERIPEKYHPMLAIINTQGSNKMLFSKLSGWLDKLKSFFTGKNYDGPVLSGYPISKRITRRQDHSEAWVPTGSIYLFKTENLKNGSFYGDRVMIMETEPTVNINTQEDFEEAEKQLVMNKISD